MTAEMIYACRSCGEAVGDDHRYWCWPKKAKKASAVMKKDCQEWSPPVDPTVKKMPFPSPKTKPW